MSLTPATSTPANRSFLTRWLTTSRMEAFMAWGAGLMLALVFVELLPEAIESLGPKPPLALSLAGLLLVFFVDRVVTPRLNFLDQLLEVGRPINDPEGPLDLEPLELAPLKPGQIEFVAAGKTQSAPCSVHRSAGSHSHGGHSHGGPLLSSGAACSIVGCLTVCTFFDGVALSSAAHDSHSHLGGMLLVAQATHLIPEAVIAASAVLAAGGSRRAARRALGLAAVAMIAGALLPWAGLGSTAIWLAITSGILLYVALAQLIPGAGPHLRTVMGVLIGAATGWLLHAR